MRESFRVAWYRIRVELPRRWAGLLGIVLLVGLTGGIGLGSIAAGRRTQSTYPKFFASTDPSDLTVSAFAADGTASESLKPTLTRVPGVASVETVDLLSFYETSSTGAPLPNATSNVFMIDSTDGELSGEDRLTVVHGRMPDPRNPREAVVTPSGARLLKTRVGQTLHLGLFTSPTEPARLHVNVTVVGVADINNQVVEDDIDSAFGFVALTPALEREVRTVAPKAVSPTLYGLRLTHGQRDVAQVQRDVIKVIPSGEQYEFHETPPVLAQVEDAVRPEVIALGAFGAIAVLVAIVMTTQAIARQLRAGDGDRQVLHALGTTKMSAVLDVLTGVLAAVAVGAVAAIAIAIALSPLAPLNPVRAVSPNRGLAVDWTVVGLGFMGFVLVLGTSACVLAFRADRPGRAYARQSTAARAVANAGLPVPAVAGTRFALESGTGAGSVPVRSTLTGTVLAVAVVAATLTFASGLHTLISHPPLYGWNWDYAVDATNAVPPQARTLLAHDHDVAGWTGVNELIIELDGLSVPALLASPKASVAPPILSGHGLQSTREIVLGAETLSRLHKRVGDTVTLTYGSPTDAPAYVPPVAVRIVGTATMPAIGFVSFVADHTSMGTGALLPYDIEPPAFRAAQLESDPTLNGPDFVLVRMRSGVSAAAGRADLQRIVKETDVALSADPNAQGQGIGVIDAQRPAQIVNYRTVGAAPVVLATGLALGAALALSLTLAASVRRRRRELALLKTLGLTRGQLAAVVAWQSTIVVTIGVVLGLPLGIASGRALWELFARAIHAVPRPTVPALTIALVGVGALVLANIVAAIPGRQAARTPTAILLQAE